MLSRGVLAVNAFYASYAHDDIALKIYESAADESFEIISKAIESGNYPEIDQNKLAGNKKILKSAPKIFKDDCRINWK